MEKIKDFLDSEQGKDLLLVSIVLLVGLGSFELGRLSAQNRQGGLKIEYPGPDSPKDANMTQSGNRTDTSSSSASAINSIVSESGKNFFASKKGKKYYTASCSAGKTIKQENRVYFTTGEEAEAAGYTLSSSCS